jgi:hypothetical protein|uniref:Uncharacterized protein n=1 Tax=Zea mays TaxID=4577 RepID=A0A804RAL8_MAIZE
MFRVQTPYGVTTTGTELLVRIARELHNRFCSVLISNSIPRINTRISVREDERKKEKKEYPSMEETCRWCGVRVQGGGGAGLGHAGAAQLRAADQSRVLGVEVDDLLEVEVQDLGDGAGVAGEPEDVLEEDGVDVHEDGAGAAPGPALLPARRRLQEQPERVGVEHEAVHRERPPLLPDHDRHRRRRGGGVGRRVDEGAVADARRRGRRPPEEHAAAGHGGGHRRMFLALLLASRWWGLALALSSSAAPRGLEWFPRGVRGSFEWPLLLSGSLAALGVVQRRKGARARLYDDAAAAGRGGGMERTVGGGFTQQGLVATGNHAM